MFNKAELKHLFRSGSFQFVRDGRPSAAGRPVAQYMWRAFRVHKYMRSNRYRRT